MGLIGRMRALKRLLDIRYGLGAAQLPPNIKRIHLDFAAKADDGHGGARKLWRLYLPRLKYHNPAVSMTVNRSTNQVGPATLTVFSSRLEQNTTSDSQEQTDIIDMKHKDQSEILKELLRTTGAKEVMATPEEEAEMCQIAEEEAKSGLDRTRSKLDLEKRRQEKRMLDHARGLGTVGGAVA